MRFIPQKIKCRFPPFFALLTALFPFNLLAKYDSNMSGKITSVLTYSASNIILFQLDNQPSTHPTCRSNYFAIATTVTPERRSALLSRLLTAYTSKERVNIGYDANQECANGYIKVYRIG